VLGIETKSLLVGEGASAEDTSAIRAAITAGPEVEQIIHMKTLYLGPEELLVGVKVAVSGKQLLSDVASSINAVEKRIREAVPIARVIYVEPDVWAPPGTAQPPTETIVIKASD
jgi:divalent metal cation (Fe/Co/Zn/Cd) transporter